MLDVIEELKWRNLIDNITDPKLIDILKEPITLYAGFDPTAGSLQVGNLAALMVLRHFLRAGHRVIALVGGATGMIGDPSGKRTEREFLSEDQVEANAVKINKELFRVLSTGFDIKDRLIIVNNYDWYSECNVIEFLREVGKYFGIGAMLAKETVRSRLESGSGISYAEFSYQLLQAYDFYVLYDRYDCILQVGGSDQWGNITAGVELIRKKKNAEVFGLTFPLICDSTGRKFGKTEGNSVFFDPEITSYFAFYQFFVRVQDVDVGRMLKVYTELTQNEIKALEEETKKCPEARVAQKRLAAEVTKLIHGEEGLRVAERASGVLFGGSMEGLKADMLEEIFGDVPSMEMAVENVINRPVFELAALSGLCSSKGEARRLLSSGGLYINNRRVIDIEERVDGKDIIDGKLVVLRSGKKNYLLVKVK